MWLHSKFSHFLSLFRGRVICDSSENCIVKGFLNKTNTRRLCGVFENWWIFIIKACMWVGKKYVENSICAREKCENESSYRMYRENHLINFMISCYSIPHSAPLSSEFSVSAVLSPLLDEYFFFFSKFSICLIAGVWVWLMGMENICVSLSTMFHNIMNLFLKFSLYF